MYFEVTHRCNQNCKHCYLDCNINNKTKELSTKEILSIITEFKKQGGTYITITGGEPFIRKDIFDILDFLESIELYFQIATNSKAINSNRLSKLLSYKYLDQFFTSFVGTNKKEHEYISTNGNFVKVFEVVAAFSKANIKVYVQVTLMKDYWKNTDELLEKLFQYKNVIVQVTPILEIGIKDSVSLRKELVINEQEKAKFMEMYKTLKLKYGDRLDKSNLSSKSDFKDEIDYYSSKELYHLSESYICLRPDGTKSYSYDLIDPYSFGNALNGLSIDKEQQNLYYKLIQEADRKIHTSMKEEQFIDIGVARSDVLKK
ncbi:MAG: radical SAM protein [Candidatus Izemoplasma sp.]